jgi:uncharacterized coiled-coil protein SlyX
MGTLEERVAYLEGRGGQQAAAIAEVRADVREVRVDVRDVRTELRDLRAEMSRRFDGVDARFAHIDTKFAWLVGFQFATFMAMIASLLNAYFR